MRIEVTGPVEPFDVVVEVPGSKSITIRALVAAGLADGRSRISGALDANDTRAARDCLRALGVEIDDRSEPWVVDGGSLTEPRGRLDAGESGLTARIMIAVAALVDGTTIVDGGGRLPERPMGGVLDGLAQLGVPVRARDGRLPVSVHGDGRIRGGRVEVDTSRSTQFATAIALIAPRAEEPVELKVQGKEGSLGYLNLTFDVLSAFGAPVTSGEGGVHIPNTGLTAADFLVEADASAAVYPWVAAAITGSTVITPGLGTGSRQPDMEVLDHLEAMGCRVDRSADAVSVSGPETMLDPLDVDLSGCPDGALGLAIACLFAGGPSRLSGLHTLADKESDRLRALAIEIEKSGALAEVVDGAGLVVTPGDLRAFDVATYGDHRVAMSFALLGLMVGGIGIDDSTVVNKTWPGYWAMLSALGAG